MDFIKGIAGLPPEMEWNWFLEEEKTQKNVYIIISSLKHALDG